MSHRFTTVAEANDVLAQLSSADGPFGQLQLTRDRSPIATTITLRGPGDFSKGLASFGDAQIAVVTGGGALGVSDAEIARQAGVTATSDVLKVKLVADLVGSKASWDLPVGKSTLIKASGQQTSWATIGGFAAALGALAVFVALGGGRRSSTAVADPEWNDVERAVTEPATDLEAADLEDERVDTECGAAGRSDGAGAGTEHGRDSS